MASCVKILAISVVLRIVLLVGSFMAQFRFILALVGTLVVFEELSMVKAGIVVIISSIGVVGFFGELQVQLKMDFIDLAQRILFR